MADPEKWLIFQNVSQKDIDPIFAGRLAALAKEMNEPIHVTGNGGKRNAADQERAYINSGGHKDAKGVWSGGSGMAAIPGTSAHEIGIAIDTADHWLKEIDKVQATARQTILLAFGLYKPLTQGNNASVLEDWHIQPIELNGLTVKQRKLFEPLLVAGNLTEFQRKNKLTPDGVYGPLTDAKAKEVYKV